MASNDIKKFVKQDLRSSIEKIMYDYKRQFENGELFNIFVSAGIEQKENYMRNFLAELLRRNGSHGMGEFFQKSFLQDVLKINFPSEEKITEIHTEDSTNEKRRMDLTIETNKRFIPIEVKINAEDQNKQCWDYYQEIVNRNKNKGWKGQAVLYYLTKDVYHRLSEESRGNLKEGKDVKYIYFNENPEMPTGNTNDIVSWLKKCLQEESVKERTRIFLGLLQFKESIEYWCNKKPELKKIRDIVDKSLKNEDKKAFTAYVENYSGNDSVILKIKECYDYYKEVILEDDFFGGIDHAMIEKTGYIIRVKEHKNRGSSYVCNKLKDYTGDYEIWLAAELSKWENKLYVGYCLGKGGKYIRYESSEIDGNAEMTKTLLGFSPSAGNCSANGEWIYQVALDCNSNDIKKLVFNKKELDKKIDECVTVLNHLLNRRYGGTENAQPRNPI